MAAAYLSRQRHIGSHWSLAGREKAVAFQVMCDAEKDWHERSFRAGASIAGKIYLSTNRKSHFLSLFLSQPCTMVKPFFHILAHSLKCLCLPAY